MYHNAVNRLALPADVAAEMIAESGAKSSSGATAGGGGGGGGESVGGGGAKHRIGFFGRRERSSSLGRAATTPNDDEEPIPTSPSPLAGRSLAEPWWKAWLPYALPAALLMAASAAWGRVAQQRRCPPARATHHRPVGTCWRLACLSCLALHFSCASLRLSFSALHLVHSQVVCQVRGGQLTLSQRRRPDRRPHRGARGSPELIPHDELLARRRDEQRDARARGRRAGWSGLRHAYAVQLPTTVDGSHARRRRHRREREWTYTLLALNCAVFEILSRIIAAEKIEWKIMFREISRSGIAPQPTLSTDETKASRRGDGAACAAPAGALPAQPASVALSVLPRARGDKYIVDSDNLIPKPSGVPIYSSL